MSVPLAPMRSRWAPARPMSFGEEFPAARAALLDECRARFDVAARRFHLFPSVMHRRDRDEIAVLHAFCRGLDDFVDEGAGAEASREDLVRVEAELRGERPPRPIVAELLAVCERAGFRLDLVTAFLDGIRSDLSLARIENDDELIRYAYRVSSTVGLMIYGILGIRGGSSRWRAVDLGIALQLTNVALDAAADAARGRVYVPRERLLREGLDFDTLLAGGGGHPLRRALIGLTETADRYYASAVQAVADLPPLYRHGVLLMSRLYRATGHRAVRRSPTPGRRRGIAYSPAVRAAAETAALALSPRVLGLARPHPHDPRLHRAIAGWPGTNPEAR